MEPNRYEGWNGAIADESFVLRACLHQIGIGSKQVVQSMTGIGHSSAEDFEQTAAYLRKSLKSIQEETLADFMEKNRCPHSVEPALTLDGQLLCVSDEELHYIFRDDNGWKRFRKKFPESRGTVDFSRVGFNSQVTQALVYTGIQVGWLMGSGDYWLYSKSEHDWVKSDSVLAWIS